MRNAMMFVCLLACELPIAPNDLDTAGGSTTSGGSTHESTSEIVGSGEAGSEGSSAGEVSTGEDGCPSCDSTTTRCDALDLLCGQLGPVGDACSTLHVMCQGAPPDEVCEFLAALAPGSAEGLAAACACAYAECPAPAVNTRR